MATTPQTFTDIQPIEAAQQTFSNIQPIAQGDTDKPSSWDSAKDFGAALWKQISPIAAVKGAAQLTSHPIDTLKNDADARTKIYDDAESAFKKGNYTEGAAHLLHAAIPFLGPQMDAAANDFMQGKIASGLGSSVGMGLALAGPKAVAETGAIPAAASGSAEAIRSGWRKIGNPMGLASSGEEMLKQGISPRTSMSGFDASLQRAAGDLKAYDAQSPIQNVHDLNDAIPEIKQKIWSEEVEPALQRQAKQPVEMQPVADAVRAQISDEMKEFDEGNAEKLESFAKKLETARDVTSANKLLKYANGQLESYFQKFPAARRANLMNNPETAGWEAARAELRNQFLDTLEKNGETGVRDARLRYGAFDTLQDAVERRVNVADRAKPMSLARIVGTVGGVAAGGIGGAGAVAAGELANYLNRPDTLIKRGIANLGTPIRTNPFNIQPASGIPLAAGTSVANSMQGNQ